MGTVYLYWLRQRIEVLQDKTNQIKASIERPELFTSIESKQLAKSFDKACYKALLIAQSNSKKTSKELIAYIDNRVTNQGLLIIGNLEKIRYRK